jgi:hypothetical protein
VVYDVFILGLMIVGISGVVVFSYKIFHSRVYPVGIVRRTPTIHEELNNATVRALSDFWATAELPEVSMLEGWHYKEIADLRLSEQNIVDYLQRQIRKKYLVPGLGLLLDRREYKNALRHLGANPFHEREDSPLEEEVVEHGEALELHSKRLEEIEKRIRRSEVKSVQELQEATEENPQPPQQVVH